jgi:hypothetical protein
MRFIFSPTNYQQHRQEADVSYSAPVLSDISNGVFRKTVEKKEP